jgi:hypothetical protein
MKSFTLRSDTVTHTELHFDISGTFVMTRMDFTGKEILECLRDMLTKGGFRLPGEVRGV